MDDMTLVPQHSICYWLDGQIEEQFVTHGKETEAFTPEEKDIALMAGIHQKNWMRDSVMRRTNFCI